MTQDADFNGLVAQVAGGEGSTLRAVTRPRPVLRDPAAGRDVPGDAAGDVGAKKNGRLRSCDAAGVCGASAAT